MMSDPELKRSIVNIDTSPAMAAMTLEALSQRHYRRPLVDLLGNVDMPLGRRQYARLLGVMLKEPFAIERKRRRSTATGAIIALDWKADDELQRAVSGTWQFACMSTLMSEQQGRSLSQGEAVQCLYNYKYETSLGKFVFEAFRDRICGDPQKSKVIREALAAAKKAGVSLTEPTVAGLSAGAASVVAVAIGSLLSAPLAAVCAPLVGGLSLLIIQTGVDGFCRWTRAVIEAPGDIDDTESKT